LENGRGQKTLHGLAGPIDKVCYSPDERFIAALSQDWQVGIWELPSGKLQHVLEVPPGAFADNAALAFNADGSRFAFSAGDQVTLWDVTTGQRVNEWPLPRGLGDMLAFHSSGQLLSVRFETHGKVLPPYTVDWRQQPCIVRLRNLFGESPRKPIHEISEFARSVPQALMARDGSFFVIEGIGGPQGNERSIRAYDGPTGKRLWSIEGLSFDHSGWLQADPSGRVLGIRPTPASAMLVKMPGGEPHGILSDDPTRILPTAMGPGADFRVQRENAPRFGYQLYRGNSATPIVTLAQDIESYAVQVQFNARGTHLAWGNVDGSVFVCDLRQIQTRLAELGFGW
jgi:WD40 repeat protein